MTGPERATTAGAIDPAALRIVDKWLVTLTEECTCGAPPAEAQWHEPECGLEPVMTTTELAAMISPRCWAARHPDRRGGHRRRRSVDRR